MNRSRSLMGGRQHNPPARSKSMVMGEMSRGPASLQERVLKAGWLKKQRSIMKNWQPRWFVLWPDRLCFYKNEEETKPQGSIQLQGSHVTELSANPEEPGRHLFEIIPGGATDEALLLMAISHTDMEDWVKAIRRAIWAPFGGGIFGQQLEDTVLYERRFGPRQAPLLVEQCVDFILEHGLREEGLFRMPGQANLVKELQDSFHCGDKPHFDRNTDVHTVASLLKLYLRELPEPVVPFAKYEDFLTCAQMLAKDEEMGIQELAKQVKTLPQVNFNLLKYICRFLDEVQSHSSENKMSVQNLATVFGPNILRPKMEDPVTIMESTSQVQHLMTVLIREHDRLFAVAHVEPPIDPRETTLNSQRGMVGWISDEEFSSTSRIACPTEDLCSSAPCLDASTTVSCIRAPQGKAEASISPSKQAKSLPAFKCPFRAHGKLGGSSVDIPSLSGSSWLMNGLPLRRGHQRTSSGGYMKDLGPLHRLSTYDNVAPSSLSVPSVATEAWNVHSASKPSQKRSFNPDLESNVGPGKGLPGQAEKVPMESGDGCRDVGPSTESICSTEGGSEGARPAEPNSNSQTLMSKVTELKEELRQQRVAYGSRIRKLEASVTALGTQVEKLQEELDQERKKHQMLEIKLRNAERAHEDAETRNRLLQKEMEEFFSTLGDLTLQAKAGKM
ncbi:rho GTPase-activating protein 22 isoform X1 [Paramormyrops kingsleyae]|uniref:rho GTPase-activating protein 22 isoform X1 n=2 Tax=Paramormyrops kingsleyae TaxID=1676925 RepID=UPI003B9715D4